MKKNIKILIADDDESILWVVERFFTEKGIAVTSAKNGVKAYELIKTNDFDAAVIDITMPGKSGLDILSEIDKGKNLPIIIMTAQGTMKNAIEAMRKGAFDYITKPFDLDELEVIVEKAAENKRLNEQVRSLKGRLKQKLTEDAVIIGNSRVMQEIFKTIGRVSPTDATVLIYGESGTGKELIARAIHANSLRAECPLVAINSAAIPRELLESELFGFEKGAFTGASEERHGKFELANNGTLFLDEIGDMSLDVQSKLLRVVQEKEFYRIGGKKPISVDVRLIAATNQDIEKAVEEKRFREDLFYRLNVVPIKVPPLRERQGDIPLLAEYFLQKFNNEMGMDLKSLSKDAVDALFSYAWQGNVRELENMLHKAVILSPNPILSRSDLATPKQRGAQKEPLEEVIYNRLEDIISRLEGKSAHELYDMILPFMERPLITLVLKKTKGNQIKAAEMLGINRNTLRKKIKELKISLKEAGK
ncbi:MAG: two-component system response regulator [Deltaproteobacteria bacterium GWC2_42_11]|nr:MAG: two-component system response regulator [Deltaproteobacteria bacterium GWC2_42_11]HBO84340.1 two-component system response regulator [Deltaproteobacteria bacterium]